MNDINVARYLLTLTVRVKTKVKFIILSKVNSHLKRSLLNYLLRRINICLKNSIAEKSVVC